MNHKYAALLFLLPLVAFGGVDQPWKDLESSGHGDAIAGLGGLAVLALVIYLLEQGEFLSFLGDLAKGLVFLAGMYLVVFGFLACAFVVSLVLQAMGLEKSTAGFIAFPAGLVLGYNIYAFLIDAQERRKKQK